MAISGDIKGWVEELAAVVKDIDWDRDEPDIGPETDKSHPIRRLFDAASLLHMNLAGVFKEPGRAERINNTLFKISNAVNTTMNLPELYESIHHSLADIIDVTNFFIALYDKEEDSLAFPYFVDETGEAPGPLLTDIQVKKSRLLTAEIIRSGKQLSIKKNERLKQLEDRGEQPYSAAAEVWLGTPLIIKNEVIGAMVVQSYTDPDLYDEKDADILTSVSEQAAIAIDRKRAEEALLVEKAHIERLFEGVQEGIAVTDANGVIVDVNPEFTRLFGYSGEEAKGAVLDDLIIPGEDMVEARDYTRRIAGGEHVAFESRRQRKNGALIDVSIIAAPISLGRDKIGQYTIYRDISEQKRANDILLTLYNISRAVNSTKSLDELYTLIHESLNAILDTTNFFIGLYDKKTDVLSLPYNVNEKDAMSRVVDVSKKYSLTMMVIDTNRTRFLSEAKIERMKESGQEIIGPIPKIWMGAPLSIKGNVIGAVVVRSFTDPNLYSEKDIGLLESVSEQIAIAIDSKRTEEALSESEKMYRTLFDNAGDAIFVHDMGRVILDVNAVACERYGYRREEFLTMAPRDLCAREAHVDGRNTIEELNEFGQVIRESMHEKRNGERIPSELNSRLIEYKGKPAVLSIIRDLTDRKRAEEEKERMAARLQNARKMEAIGTLAGGVAHDLNNILSGLVSYPELLLLDLPGDSPMRDGILLIQKSGNRAAAIVQDLLTLARRGVVVAEVVDVNRIIADHLDSPEHKALRGHHPHARVETDLEGDLLKIMGSPVHLSKTVMNLVSNAAEAMPDGGVIAISTRNRYLDRPVKGYDDVRSGDYVTLTVSDQGTGILPADMERIFEPFYTKKVMGRSGTGLGMAVVWGTVKDHKGYIDIRTEEGRGSRFTLYFPITREESAKDHTPISTGDFMGRGERVVGVDDVEDQRMILSAILKTLNYSVKMFPGGEEAAAYMKTHSADLLILDMIMDPGIDGLTTYKKIIERHPGQKAIIVSGFSETERVREAQKLGAGAYVKKPYMLNTIGPAIRKELEK